jgi:hypothetical protein
MLAKSVSTLDAGEVYFGNVSCPTSVLIKIEQLKFFAACATSRKLDEGSNILQLPIDDEKQNQKLIHSKDDH